MINITTSTSAKATRNNPTRMTIVQETIEILSVLNHIHIHNIKDEINTEDANRANLIATHRLLEISTVIKDRPATMSVIRDRLVVKNARTDLIVVRQDPLHRIHPGRAVRKGNRTIIQKDRMDIHGLSQFIFCRHDNEDVDVAVRMRATVGIGAKKNDLLRSKPLSNVT